MSDSLDRYRKKRDFDKTREPAPAKVRRSSADRKPVYVIHRHSARRLHYDLRIEVDGVLSSWAVPKGFSYDPRNKHLAVRTEDHPIEYEHFSGHIPQGEYGAGSMTIWDRGTYDIVLANTAKEAIQSGELKLILYGRRLRGEFHLVKTKQGENTWLLFKSKDRYAAKGRDAALGLDLTKAPEANFPRTVTKMEPGERGDAFHDPEWIFEMQFVGKRLLVAKRGDEVKLRSLRKRLPELERAALKLRAENALLDGMLVALDEGQRPCVTSLEEALQEGATERIQYYAFDLLYYEDYDLRGLPLLRRKEVLRHILPDPGALLYVDHVLGEGTKLADAVEAAGLRGMIAKHIESSYIAGEDASWRSIRIAARKNEVHATLTKALERRARRPRKKSPYKNLNKVFWPAEGITKGDLIAHYERVAELILPYLYERPVHLNRFPDGIEGQSFYQRQPHEDFPAWIDTEIISDSRDGEAHGHMVCNSRDALMYLINLGSIDLHPWLSRRRTPNEPDFAVIDLDPKEAPFQNVVRIAIAVGKLLIGIGLRPLLKTSGASGLHIYVPLVPGYTYQHSRTFCEIVARIMVRDLPQIATIERHMGSRQGKVYVDYGQNRRGQTVVPPYVLRPVPGAGCSTPLHWDELTPSLDRAQFNIHTIGPRIESHGDLFAAALTDKQQLDGALTELGKQLGG